AQVLEHREQLLVRRAALAHRGHGFGFALLLVVVVVERYGYGERQRDELLAPGIDRNQTVVFDILVHQPEYQRLADQGAPILRIVRLAGPEPPALVVAVALDERRILAREHR